MVTTITTTTTTTTINDNNGSCYLNSDFVPAPFQVLFNH